MYKKLLIIALLLGIAPAIAQNIQLKDNHPQSYTVKKGDTLWDIAGRFLQNPWQWRKIWNDNRHIKNPHKIYPGDVIYASFFNGQPQLAVKPSLIKGEIKLSPHTRVEPVAQAIPTIPLSAISSFLIDNRIIDDIDIYNSAPYVLAGDAKRVITGAGDRIYARGNFNAGTEYAIYRQGKTYRDPDTGEFLGINIDETAVADLVAIDDEKRNDLQRKFQIGTLVINKTNTEVMSSDRLFPTESRNIEATFHPSEPNVRVTGSIIDVPRGVNQIGKFDVVALNKGTRDGLEVGNVLAVYKSGETVRDRVTDTFVKVPDERAGLLMVFKTYNKLSFGIVLYVSRQLTIGDRFTNP